MSDIYVVILAGGCGQRLWPLSSRERPKQFIPLVGKQTLIELTLQRAQLIARDKEHIIIVSNRLYQTRLEQICKSACGTIIYEPVGRNTAPAILLSCLDIYKQNPEATVVVLPADHFIPDNKQCVATIKNVFDIVANNDVIGLLGIQPTFPATGYGYIQKGELYTQADGMYSVAMFHEKPNKEMAYSYYNAGGMLWNSGIFVGKVAAFIAEYAVYAPDIYEKIQNYQQGLFPYDLVPNRSIDVAVIEKSKNIIVALASFEWHDVGSLESFLRIASQYDKTLPKIVSYGGSNNIAYTTEKMVVCSGISNICLIETETAFFIFDRKKEDSLKNIMI